MSTTLDAQPITRRERHRLYALVAGSMAILTVAAFALGSTAQRAADDTTGPAPMPACETGTSPDFNDGSMALCYTVTVDGFVVVIDATDTVVSVSAS
jgi:hypothetical protein